MKAARKHHHQKKKQRDLHKNSKARAVRVVETIEGVDQ